MLLLLHDKWCSLLCLFLFSSTLNQVITMGAALQKYAFYAFHLHHFVGKIFFSFCSISMKLNKIIIGFFPVSRTIFVIKTLSQKFATRWCCKWFHCVAHGHFTILGHKFYNYSSFHLEIIGVATDFSGHTIYNLFILKYS